MSRSASNSNPPVDAGSPEARGDSSRSAVRTPRGRARVRVRDTAIDPAAIAQECAAWTERDSGVRWRAFGLDLVLKGGPVPRSASRRHGLRRLLLRAPSPCEAEYSNLEWLRGRLFRAAEPIASVTVHRLGFPRHQLLATREVPKARPFEETWRAADEPARARIASELGREVGRMHALRFLHGDLYPRNVLVAPEADDGSPGQGRSLVWIDAWAGGPTAWRRGSLRRVEQDLGAWFSIAADWTTEADWAVLIAAYVRGRADGGRPVRSARTLVARVQRARRRELERLERDRRRLRGRPFPVAGWDPPLEPVERAVERAMESARDA